MQQIKLNLGCGHETVDGWINVDYALGARLAKIPFFHTINRKLKLLELNWDRKIFIHDLRKPFPWKDNTVDIIYSSHTLEHFSKEEGVFFLKESCRVLKIHGLIRIIVPDLRTLVSRYVNREVRADDFIDELFIRYESEHDGYLKKKIAPFVRFPHKCLYDMETLLQKMNWLGFDASSKNPFESDIPDIQNIEKTERTKGVVIVEGQKRELLS